MIKKLLITSVIFATSLNAVSHAGLYLGGGLGVQNISKTNDLIAQIFGGYGTNTSDMVYLGGELFLDGGSIALSSHQYNRISYSGGASFIPGIVLNENTMVYGRIGVRASHLHESSNTRTGSQLGAGIQTSIAQGWDIRGEYVYTGKGIFNGFGTTESNQFNVGIVYKFG